MEVTIKGKVYNLVRTLHLTETSSDTELSPATHDTNRTYFKCHRSSQQASFIVYDEFVDDKLVTRVLYFNDWDLEDIKLL